MIETNQYWRVVRTPAWVWLLPVVLLIAGVALAGCGDDDSGDSDPAGLLARYQEARNSGDVDAVIAFYADDAVIVGHPRDSVSIGEESSEGNEVTVEDDKITRYEWGTTDESLCK